MSDLPRLITVFVTDDHLMVIEGIRALLSTKPNIEWMGHATDSDACMRALSDQQPDVLFLDINLPGKSGIELCHEVKQKYPVIHVIGISSFNQMSYISKMLNNKASGYLLKNAGVDEIIDAIGVVMSGGIYLSAEAKTIMSGLEQSPAPVITKREKEVLNLIAEGLTNNEIAERLFISQTTVETHRKNLLAKFDTNNAANLIKLAGQFGFI